MALHLNLFHEIEKQKALNRRDPLKLSMIGLGLVAAGFAGFYLWELTVQHGLSSELDAKQAEYNKLKPQAEAAQKKEQELSGTAKLSEALVKHVEGRFYWATVLDDLTQIVPREIQVTKLTGEMSQDKARRCTITVEGLSAGAEPRKVAEDLRRALASKFTPKYKNVTATFRSLEDGKDQARLDGQQLPTALFAINLQMVTGEEDAPPPPPKRVPKKPAGES